MAALAFVVRFKEFSPGVRRFIIKTRLDLPLFTEWEGSYDALKQLHWDALPDSCALHRHSQLYYSGAVASRAFLFGVYLQGQVKDVPKELHCSGSHPQHNRGDKMRTELEAGPEP